MTVVAIRSVGLDKIPIEVKMLLMIVVPIFFIWLVFRYDNPGKSRKYRIITFTYVGIWLYLTAIAGILNKYYPKIFERYHTILTILVMGSLFLAAIIGCISTYKIMLYDDNYNNLL